MSVVSAQSITADFTTRNPSTGAAVNADSLPTGTLVVSGTDNAATVTVTNTGTGIYKAQVTLPTLSSGAVCQIRIQATVSSITDNGVIWTDTADLAIGNFTANALQLAGQTITAATGVTFPASVGNSTFAGGAVASVTGAVGSVTANVTANLAGNQTFYVGGVTAPVTFSGNISANVLQWGSVNVTGMPMPTYAQPSGFLSCTFPATVGNSTFAIGQNVGNATGVTGNVTLAPTQSFNNAGNSTGFVGGVTGNVTLGPTQAFNWTGNQTGGNTQLAALLASPTAFSAPALANAPTGGGGGTGAFAVIVSTGIVGATVRISGAQVALVVADGSGNAAFSLNAGTVTVSATAPGYTGVTSTQVVNGSGHWVSTGTATLAVTLTAVAIPSAPIANQTTLFCYLYNGDGSIAVGKTFQMKILKSGTTANIWNQTPVVSSVSDGTGLAYVSAEIASTVQIASNGFNWTPAAGVVVPAGTSFNAGPLVGPF